MQHPPGPSWALAADASRLPRAPLRYPEVIRGGGSTFSILFDHSQTVSIFAQLQLEWPPAVRSVLEILGVNVFSLEISRPECLLGTVDQETGGAFYLINMVKFIALLSVFAAIVILQRLIWVKGIVSRRREKARIQRRIRRGEVHAMKPKQRGRARSARPSSAYAWARTQRKALLSLPLTSADPHAAFGAAAHR